MFTIALFMMLSYLVCFHLNGQRSFKENVQISTFLRMRHIYMKPKKKQKEASLSLSLSSVPIHVQARRLKARFSWHMVRSAGRSERKCGICADPAVFDAVTSGAQGWD